MKTWVVFLVCLSATACFHSVDATKVKCTTSDHCPSNFVCVASKCVSRSTVAADGGNLGVDSGASVDGKAVGVDATELRADVGSDVSAPTLDVTPEELDSADTTDVPLPGTGGVIGAGGATGAGGIIGSGGGGASTGGAPGSGGGVSSGGTGDAGRDVALDVASDIGPDLPPTGCTIAGSIYPAGFTNSANACQVCKPAISSSTWSNADEGASCSGGQYCNSGTCKSGCFIAGSFYANAAANPTNACQTCQASFAATSWTTGANGASCGSGQVCNGGTCQSGCWIDGALVGSGATNAANVCQICKPTASASAWSNNTDGTACGTGKVCGTGSCQAGCYVGGLVYATGGLNPTNTCQSCNPSISTTAWYQVPSDCATIAAHNGFACATTGGSAKCWGVNGYSDRSGSGSGLLGIGQSYAQIAESPVPLTVSGLTVGVQAISTGNGSHHSCAVVNGGVMCWGANSSGQIGNGTTTDANAPTQVAGLTSGVQGVASGLAFSCAIANGELYCWGSNDSGQLGVDPSTNGTSLSPVKVPLSGNIQAIATGNSHMCALVSGSVWCWGSNAAGELGNNSSATNSYVRVQPVGLAANVQAIAAGDYFTCALSAGSLSCWGRNTFGQLGDGTIVDHPAPVAVQGLSIGVQAVATGSQHTCAVVNGAAWCWGYNHYGALGDNTTTDRASPVSVQGLTSGVQSITAGSAHTCALTSAGAKCWGFNGSGELGNNSTIDSSVPVAVQGL